MYNLDGGASAADWPPFYTNLRRTGYTGRIIVIVPRENKTWAAGAFLHNTFNVSLHTFPTAQYHRTTRLSRWSLQWSKIELWALEQCSRVQYYDVDHRFFRAPEIACEHTPHCAIVDEGQGCDGMGGAEGEYSCWRNRGYGRGGFIDLAPSKRIHMELMVKFRNFPTLDFAEQDYFNVMFRDITHRVPPRHSMSPEQYCENNFRRPIAVFHLDQYRCDRTHAVRDRNPGTPKYRRQYALAQAVANRSRALYVIIGTLRGGVPTWCSFAHSLPPNSDVALFIGKSSPDLPDFRACLERSGIKLVAIWYSGEHSNWNEVLDTAGDPDWYWSYPPSQYLGRIHPGHAGTAGILLAYRQLLQKKLVGMTGYDRLVLTRSDFMYMCKQMLPEPNNRVYVLEGEAYGGVTDRFTVFPWHMAHTGLNVTTWLISRAKTHPWHRWLTRYFSWTTHYLIRPKIENLETLLGIYFDAVGLDVSLMPRAQFVVRRTNGIDASVWSQGEAVDPALTQQNLLVKYPNEYFAAQRTCGIPGCAATAATCFD